MKYKIILMSLLLTLISVPSSAQTIETRDFTFGLSDYFPAVKAFKNDDDGHDTFDRFMQVKNELPDEIPVFKPYETKAAHEIYMSPNGSDANPGTIDEPVKSFEAAFYIASKLSDKTGGVIVYLREGVYNTLTGVEIPEGVSGSDEHPFIISAYPGEDVKVTGGINVGGSRFKIADDS